MENEMKLCGGVGMAVELVADNQVTCPRCGETLGTSACKPLLVANVPAHLEPGKVMARERVSHEETDGEDRVELERGARPVGEKLGFSADPLAHLGDDDIPF